MDDTVLTTNVKTAVFNEPLLKAAEINEDDLQATLPGLGSVGRPLFGRAAMTRQVPRRVDQAHVRECLGKIADQASPSFSEPGNVSPSPALKSWSSFAGPPPYIKTSI